MKKLFFLFTFCSLIFPFLPAHALTFTVSDAVEKFKARDLDSDGIKNALDAANMFHELYKEAKAQGKSDLVQAQLLSMESKSIYFYADNTSNNEAKKAGHKRGWDVGADAAALLHKPGSPTAPKLTEYSRPLAVAYYWQGANMGRWGIANGVLNSLARWPELKKTMNYIEALGEKDVESFGANRILGRSYFKLPFPLGDMNKSLELLEEAFDQTLDESGELSTHSTNVVFYADTLVAKNKKEKARTILKALIAKGASLQSLREYNEERIPETKADIIEAKNILSRID